MPEDKMILTLCLLCRNGRIALAKKLRGFGVGKWNGYGGHVEDGETIMDTTIRETREESEANISPLALKKVAVLDFHFADGRQVRQMHVFVATSWEREPMASEEMGEPRWFSLDGLKEIEEEMWAADRIWLTAVLSGRIISGTFHYNADGSKVEDYELADTVF